MCLGDLYKINVVCLLINCFSCVWRVCCFVDKKLINRNWLVGNFVIESVVIVV